MSRAFSFLGHRKDMIIYLKKDKNVIKIQSSEKLAETGLLPLNMYLGPEPHQILYHDYPIKS